MQFENCTADRYTSESFSILVLELNQKLNDFFYRVSELMLPTFYYIELINRGIKQCKLKHVLLYFISYLPSFVICPDFFFYLFIF